MGDLILIRKRWHHMGNHSGSDLLFEAISNSSSNINIFVNQVSVPSKSLFLRVLERLNMVSKVNLWSMQLSSINGIKEIYSMDMAVKHLRKNPKSALFVSCGEEQLTKHVIDLNPAIKARIHVLLHQPSSWYESEPVFFRCLNGLGSVFVFSNRMKLFWESKIDSPVYKILHGVDFEFFKPNPNIGKQNEKSIICVGSWCRDFNLLYELWLRLYQFDSRLSLTLISSNDALKNEGFIKLLKLPNVTHTTCLDSNQLLEAYQSACLHVLPLLDGVANNALVESLATACPVLVTDAGSSSEYVPSNHFGLALKGDVDDHYQKALTLLRDSKLRNDMANMQRQFALSKLSWPDISQYVLNVIS